MFRLETLHVANYRCFGDLAWREIDPSLNVLIGPNASGKTTILDALSVALTPYTREFVGSLGHTISDWDVRRVSGSGTLPKRVSAPVEIAASLMGDGARCHWEVSRASSASARTRRAGASPLKDLARNRSEGRLQGEPLPVIAYYGTGRLWRQMSHTTARRGMQMHDGYLDCLNPNVDFNALEHWLQLVTLDVGKPSARSVPERSLDFFRAVVSTVLGPIGVSRVEYLATLGELMAETSQLNRVASAAPPDQWSDEGDSVWLPVRQLSDGVRSTVGLVGDIVRRISLLNGDIEGLDLSQTSGIVMVDEIDLHLHPAWQQSIVGALRDALPRIQWILTTHSPQVISTTPRQSVWDLRFSSGSSDSVRVENPDVQTEGVESGDVLAEVFGVDPLPHTPWRARLNAVEALMRAGGIAEAASEIAELEDHFGDDYFPLQSLLMEYQEGVPSPYEGD